VSNQTQNNNHQGEINMTLIRWNPARQLPAWHPVTDMLNEFGAMQREIDRMFDRWEGGTVDKGNTSITFMPVVDVVERESSFDINVELPGVKKEDVKITVHDGVLTVSGEKKYEEERKGTDYHRAERAYGSFQRSFTLPKGVSPEKIEASYTDGVLIISLPKVEEAKPKEIEVKVK
jgi:HSP20 family protein